MSLTVDLSLSPNLSLTMCLIVETGGLTVEADQSIVGRM